MNLGISTYSFPWSIGVPSIYANRMCYKDLMLYAQKNKIQYIQFGDNMPLYDLAEQIEEIKQHALEYGTNIQVGTRRLTKINIENYLSIAAYLGSPFLRVVIDDTDFYPDVDEVINIIHDLIPVLEEKNICLAIENHDRFKAKTLEHIIKTTSEKYVGICLDTANSLGAGEGIHEILPVLLPYIVNLHIKDFTIERVNHKMGFNVHGTPAGKGMLDIPDLIARCNESRNCKTATLEIWMNNEDTIEETISKERNWVEESIHYLQQFIS